MSNRELTESMGDHYKTRGNFIDYAEKFLIGPASTI